MPAPRDRSPVRRKSPRESGDGARPVRFEQNDSLEASDPHALLFGADADEGVPFEDEPARYATSASRRESSRQVRQRERRRRRRRRLASLVALLAAVLLAATAWFVVRPLVEDHLAAQDWSGSGSGSVLVQVKPNDTSDNIGSTLVKNGVVRSKRAFTDAADNNKDALSIQPGYYRLRKHMAAKQALTLLLQPSARVSHDVTIPEGLIEQDVI